VPSEATRPRIWMPQPSRVTAPEPPPAPWETMLALVPTTTAGSAKLVERRAIEPPTVLFVPPSRAEPVRRVVRTVRLGPERTLPSTLMAPPAVTLIAPPAALALPESIVAPEAMLTSWATVAVIAPPPALEDERAELEMIAVPLRARLP